MTPLADLIRLAEHSNGRIPAEIPHHYVQWALAVHRHKRIVTSLDYTIRKPAKKGADAKVANLPPPVIYLAG